MLAEERAMRRTPGNPVQGGFASAAPGPSGASVFVGREAELTALVEGLEAARAGEGRLFLLAGEPGIGKSRLADELGSIALDRGARVLWGRCWEAGGAPAYWPWVQSIRALIRGRDPERLERELGAGAADVAQIISELRDMLPNLPEPPPLDPESARFRLFDVTARFLVAAASSEALVLVLDDLHAADAPSLLLLRFLAGEIAESRLLVVGSFRDVALERDHPLSVALAELGRAPVTRRLHLRGLDRDDVARFIQLSTGTRPSGRLVATVHEETQGNPLFMVEVVRLLAREGRIGAAATVEWTTPILEGVREVIGRRLSHLGGDATEVLTLASVLGREFDLESLGSLAGRPAPELLAALEEAVAARIVTDLPGTPGRSSGHRREHHPPGGGERSGRVHPPRDAVARRVRGHLLWSDPRAGAPGGGPGRSGGGSERGPAPRS